MVSQKNSSQMTKINIFLLHLTLDMPLSLQTLKDKMGSAYFHLTDYDIDGTIFFWGICIYQIWYELFMWIYYMSKFFKVVLWLDCRDKVHSY